MTDYNNKPLTEEMIREYLMDIISKDCKERDVDPEEAFSLYKTFEGYNEAYITEDNPKGYFRYHQIGGSGDRLVAITGDKGLEEYLKAFETACKNYKYEE